ncbi:MAG: hypothetical protein ATN34_03080 [Epulopiscium sp. Nele67-Bin002]|nr:MAG: hypothetical protein ATN34_03080 [Epulopiscium sp. Nele67-Bin002]
MALDLVIVDKARFFDAIEMYFLWKELDQRIRSSATRGINFPETISEALACYALGFKWNKGSGGDAIDGDKIIEFKATSNWDRDTTSFSSSEKFDNLYFLRLDKRNDELYIYDTQLNSDKLKLIKVNKKETLEEQQKAGRRPRFSMINFIIDPNKLEPIMKVKIREKKVIKL